ncbi:MAG TPA: ParB/RepB/Spo0J family partition protein [Streptosporangiaceae bacterium]|nr:ParB/RepB/Spo0J family partition protein [Streptosporangiaceae bacterium]
MHEPTEPAVTTTTSTNPADTQPQGQPDPARPATPSRLMIAVSDLAAHPGNARCDMNLTEEFCASVAAEGVRIPLLVTPGPDGSGWRVIEGHRRLAAAVKAGLPEVPCHIDPARAQDEAGQYVDMLLANSNGYRANYTIFEETAALFAAHEAGASRTRLRKATGRTPAQIKSGLAVGGLTTGTRAKAAELDREITLDELALLAEFDGDTDATDRLLTAIDHGYPPEHTAQQIRLDRADAAQHAQLLADLQAAGITVTSNLPDGAAWLDGLTHDSQDLTPDTHAACPGHGATFSQWNQLQPLYYCTSPDDHGHASRYARSGTPAGTSLPGHNGTTGDIRTGQPDPAADADRRLVVAGNKAWQAAAEVRHRWLATGLFARRGLPRQAQLFLARQLLAMPEPLRTGLPAARHRPLMAAVTGRDSEQWERECDAAPAGRLTVIALAPLVAAYEHAMTEGEGRNTWRTGRYSPCPRADAGRYLTFLSSLGYELSAIERSVADGVPWTGEAMPGVLGEPDQAQDGAEHQPTVGHPDQETGDDSDPGRAAA